MIDNVYVASPPDYAHSMAFYDMAMSFSYSLKNLGHRADATIDGSVLGRSLVFGGHLIPKFGGKAEGDFIFFNTEQLYDGSPWVTEGYVELLHRYPVWDYSYNNVEWLREKGIYAKFCGIGYHPCMSNIPGKSVTVKGRSSLDYADWGVGLPVGVFDVLFYGSMNDRRQKIVDGLRAAGKNVVVVSGYGAYRDKYIERAKVVLNVHYYDTAIFEAVRVSHLLANRKCVVSEIGLDTKLEEPYQYGVAFAHYDNLVSKCLEVLENESLRKSYESDWFRNMSQVEMLRHVG